MAAIRLLFSDIDKLTMYRVDASSVSPINVYNKSPQGLASFSHDIKRNLQDTYYLISETLEESYHADFVPFVKGNARDELIKRRLSKVFPSTDFRLALSIGFEQTKRIDERLLLIALGNPDPVYQWLTILQEHQARIAGVYSTSLLVPMLLKVVGKPAPWSLVISFTSSGMRLTLCENNILRFSRLITPPSFDPVDLSGFCIEETRKTIDYLLTARILPKNLPQLSVLLITPEIDIAIFDQVLQPTLSLKPHFVSLETCAAQFGLKDYPQTGLADPIFCHLLYQSPPTEQFAPPKVLKSFRLANLKKTMTLWTAMIVILCLGGGLFFAFKGLACYQQLEALTEQNSQQRAELMRTAQTVLGHTENMGELRQLAQTHYYLQQRDQINLETWFVLLDQLREKHSSIHFNQISWLALTPDKKADLLKVHLVISGEVRLNQKNVPHKALEKAVEEIQLFGDNLSKAFRGNVSIHHVLFDIINNQPIKINQAAFEQNQYPFEIECVFPLTPPVREVSP